MRAITTPHQPDPSAAAPADEDQAWDDPWADDEEIPVPEVAVPPPYGLPEGTADVLAADTASAIAHQRAADTKAGLLATAASLILPALGVPKLAAPETLAATAGWGAVLALVVTLVLAAATVMPRLGRHATRTGFARLADLAGSDPVVLDAADRARDRSRAAGTAACEAWAAARLARRKYRLVRLIAISAVSTPILAFVAKALTVAGR
jgi:hypothetical protein